MLQKALSTLAKTLLLLGLLYAVLWTAEALGHLLTELMPW